MPGSRAPGTVTLWGVGGGAIFLKPPEGDEAAYEQGAKEVFRSPAASRLEELTAPGHPSRPLHRVLVCWIQHQLNEGEGGASP